MTPDAQVYERIKALVDGLDGIGCEQARWKLINMSQEISVFAIEQYEARQWRDIESAPKDGTTILLLLSANEVTAGAYLLNERWPDNPWKVFDAYFTDDPTNGSPEGKHGPLAWMPLPPTPTAATPDMGQEG